jgi:hypothetical protein
MVNIHAERQVDRNTAKEQAEGQVDSNTGEDIRRRIGRQE